MIGVQESTRYFSAIHCALVLTSKEEVGARQLTKQMDRSAVRSCTSPLPSRPLHLTFILYNVHVHLIVPLSLHLYNSITCYIRHSHKEGK